MFDPAKPSIAVAFVVDSSGRSLLTWNENWVAFSLPMTRVDLEAPAEIPEQAAVRAAAEVLRVHCRVVAGKQTQLFRGLQKSDRDAEIKDYQYNVFQVEPHRDFASRRIPTDVKIRRNATARLRRMVLDIVCLKSRP